MFKTNLANNSVVVFSRWSRKGYAIFASLKKVICIAQLSFDVCDAALLKNPSVVVLQQLDMNEDEEKDPDVISKQEELLCLAGLLPVVSVVNNDIYQDIIFNYLKKPVFCLTQNTGFFILTQLV